MELILACTAGIVLGAGVYAMLKDSLVQIVVGIILLGYGANLMVFLSGGLSLGKPAFVSGNSEQITNGISDPIPQALVLTAIVIGFGITAFILVLFHRANLVVGSNSAQDYLSGENKD